MHETVKSHDGCFFADLEWDGRTLHSKISCKYVIDPRNNKYLGIKYLPSLKENGMYEAEGSIKISTQESYDETVEIVNAMLREYERIRNIVEE